MKLDFFKEWDWLRKGKPDQAISTSVGIALYDWALPVHIAVNAALHIEEGDFSICITILCFYWDFSIWNDQKREPVDSALCSRDD